ncbi:MAG: LPXTG cell wall anchor domain-containing protein [Acidimicrobiales bacterium]
MGETSCPELEVALEIDAGWTVVDIGAGDLPDQGSSQTYVLSDRGTPDDDSDDATVTITVVTAGKVFDWTSNIGIDAILVTGGSEGSYFYGYQPDVSKEGAVVGEGAEATSDVDLGTPPYGQPGKNPIKSISFCFDDEHKPPSSSTTSSSTPSSSSTTSSTAPTTSSSDTTMPTTTTTAPVVSVTTAPPTVPVTNQPGSLPQTGSNSTGLLLALGGVLVLGGGAVLATTCIARRGSG